MTASRRTSIVIADDHHIVREGIAALCAAQPNLVVLGQCSDGEAAVEMILDLKPDFGLLDLQMPRLSGIEAIRCLRESGSTTRLMILSISREERHVAEALRAGADGYLLKDGPSRHLLEAIRYVQEGGVYITPLLGGAVMLAVPPAVRSEDPLAPLSRREYEVFSYLVNGMRAKDIAALLNLSPKTVDTYRANLMRKLNVRDIVELVKFAIERNLTST